MKRLRSIGGMELIISLVLQVGVILSLSVILIGLSLFFSQNRQGASLNGSFHQFTAPSYSFPHSVTALKSSLYAGKGAGIIELGILLLVITPIIRVATSIILFIYRRDLAMTLVTIFVLIVLSGSFVVGVFVK